MGSGHVCTAEASGRGQGSEVLLPRPLQEANEVWDALVPSLACAAAYTGELEALQVLVELVGLSPTLGNQPGHTGPGVGWVAFPGACSPHCSRRDLAALPAVLSPWPPWPSRPCLGG